MNLIELDRALRQLRLSGMAAVLDTRLRQAQTEKMAPIDLVSALVADELRRRQDRLLERRHKLARFRDPERSLDIDKAWHGLHFLFTGTADEGDEPACFIVRGGEPLDDDGYARALRPDAVAGFARFVESLSRPELASPTEEMARSSSRNWRRPARTTAWSSAIRTRAIEGCLGSCLSSVAPMRSPSHRR